MTPLIAQDFIYSMARGPPASVNKRCGEGGGGGRVAGSSDEDHRQGEWHHRVLLGASHTISYIRVPITCTACRRCLRTKADAFKVNLN